MLFTLEEIIAKLEKIKAKGFIPVQKEDFRSDDGVVGQVLEREFDVVENNLTLADLGNYELKALRKKSKVMTLCHKTSERGMTPIQIFERFHYIRPSNKNPNVIKKKLFVTLNGKKPNPQGLHLNPISKSVFDVYHQDEFLATWDLSSSLHKIEKVILVIAETKGKANTYDEMFHYNQAFLLEGFKNLDTLIKEGIVVLEFNIDQPVDLSKSPHDRGPHIRVSKGKIKKAYNTFRQIM